jgi:hypothetical protein
MAGGALIPPVARGGRDSAFFSCAWGKTIFKKDLLLFFGEYDLIHALFDQGRRREAS